MTTTTIAPTFTCICGEVDHDLIEGPDGDPSTWCECGRRIEDLRALAHANAATCLRPHDSHGYHTDLPEGEAEVNWCEAHAADAQHAA